MTGVIKLSELTAGTRAVVTRIDPQHSKRGRLRDLGIICGAEVLSAYKSPLGDPVAYLIQGAVIALRREDSSAVWVRQVQEHEN